jgi:hypothetical protein
MKLRQEFLVVCRRPQSVERDARLAVLYDHISEQAAALTGGGTPVTS